MPKISVLIPTLGREKEPIDTVRALMKQTQVPHEIVVVDQNLPANSALNEYFKSVSIVRHIRSDRPGVVFNYNLALKNASQDIVLYLDDDIVPEVHLIEMHLKAYEDPTVAAVAGRVHQPSGDLDPKDISEFGVYRKWSGKMLAHFNADKKREVMIAPGGNMSFLRQKLLETQGFDLGFDGNGYYFETDGSLRFTSSGNRMIFEPTAEVDHLAAPRGGARMADKALHTFYYVKNGIRLYRRHSPAMGLPFYVLKMLGYAFVKALYNIDPKIAIKGLEGVLQGLTQNMKVRSNLND